MVRSTAISRPLPYDQARTWGLVGWARQILGVAFDGISDTVDYQLRKLLAEERYFRYQIRLDKDQDALDDASDENVRELKILAKGLIQQESNNIDKLCSMLV